MPYRATALAFALVVSGLAAPNVAMAAPPENHVVKVAQIQKPSDTQAAALTDATIRAFLQSVREKSMQPLWATTSKRFQERVSVSQLDEAFKSFYAGTITGDPLKRKSPVFTSRPEVTAAEKLVVVGYYPTTPNRISFQLGYLLEGHTWKIISVNIKAAPVD